MSVCSRRHQVLAGPVEAAYEPFLLAVSVTLFSDANDIPLIRHAATPFESPDSLVISGSRNGL